MNEDKYAQGRQHASLGMKPVHRDTNYEKGYEDATVQRAYTEAKKAKKPSSRAGNQLRKTQESLHHLGAGKSYGEK